jgi:hypothetical protein
VDFVLKAVSFQAYASNAAADPFRRGSAAAAIQDHQMNTGQVEIMLN